MFYNHQKEGCGIVEAVKSSWEFTRGKCIPIAIASVALLVAIFALFVVLFLLMLIPVCGIVFAIPYLALAIGIQALWPYAAVEVYSQLVGMREGKSVEKKAAVAVKKEAAKKPATAKKGKK